jgi:hypothetical protein
MTPSTMEFRGNDSTWVMRITSDRRIEVNEDVEVTEAAQKVLDAMQHLLAAQLNKLIADERSACAKVCDELHWPWRMGDNSGPKECAAAIRARGNT